MSTGSIRLSFASTAAFSAVPPIPIPSIPGGHQPAPIVGKVFTTQSAISSLGLSITILDLFSEPPPLAAIITSIFSPATMSICTTDGVLSLVFLRAPAGSATIEARSGLSGLRYARRVPSSTISWTVMSVLSHVTPIPTLTKQVTIPVSWHKGRLPSADMRELIRICAIASFAAWLFSFL